METSMSRALNGVKHTNLAFYSPTTGYWIPPRISLLSVERKRFPMLKLRDNAASGLYTSLSQAGKALKRGIVTPSLPSSHPFFLYLAPNVTISILELVSQIL